MAFYPYEETDDVLTVVQRAIDTAQRMNAPAYIVVRDNALAVTRHPFRNELPLEVICPTRKSLNTGFRPIDTD